ncbi:MAG: gamma-glutamyl-gamma-aminobutyrate hydrolase family protein [Acidimicrobiales bacterium]
MHARIGVAAAPGQMDFPVHAVNRVYVSAVRAAGGLPVVVPTLDSADAPAMVAELDGLVVSGGGDLDPATYGGTAGPDLKGVDPERDRWELALVVAAEEAGVPVLGICRGMQALNVAAGGTLVPHLPDVSEVAHWVGQRDCEAVHEVRVTEGSLLFGLTGPMCGVNSLHHQAVHRLGAGLQAVAWAPDGVVEAVEDTRWGRTLGVQWHPELLTADPAQAALWRWLVGAAETWRSLRPGTTLVPVAGRPADLAVVPADGPPPATVGQVA